MDAADFTHRLDDVIEVYGQAMSYNAALLSSRRGYMATHVHRPGFRAVATIDDRGRLVGFGYGYLSERGQWWHDQVRAACAGTTAMPGSPTASRSSSCMCGRPHRVTESAPPS